MAHVSRSIVGMARMTSCYTGFETADGDEEELVYPGKLEIYPRKPKSMSTVCNPGSAHTCKFPHVQKIALPIFSAILELNTQQCV